MANRTLDSVLTEFRAKVRVGLNGASFDAGKAPAEPNEGAFMPVLSQYTPDAAGLAQAKAENAELFAGVEIFGSKGDKLLFADGTVVDTILGAGGPADGRRWTWQVKKPVFSSELKDYVADGATVVLRKILRDIAPAESAAAPSNSETRKGGPDLELPWEE